MLKANVSPVTPAPLDDAPPPGQSGHVLIAAFSPATPPACSPRLTLPEVMRLCLHLSPDFHHFHSPFPPNFSFLCAAPVLSIHPTSLSSATNSSCFFLCRRKKKSLCRTLDFSSRSLRFPSTFLVFIFFGLLSLGVSPGPSQTVVCYVLL